MSEPTPELRAAVRLNLTPGVGPRTAEVLCGTFGSPAAVFAAADADLRRISGIGAKVVGALRRTTERDADEELRRAADAGVTVLHLGGPGYPPLLAEIPTAPRVLYVRGTLTPNDAAAIAMVGSRRCSTYGARTAGTLARSLARAGLTVVSGMALGIDAAAHRGALEAGGRTLAVTATGMDTVYPPQHRGLAEEIAANGAIVTEFPMGQAPTRGLFPQRNRVIAGLSLGVILVEAGRKSGALHTIRHALEQNREVFVVPGRIDDGCDGCLDALRDGATLIRDADDVLADLGGEWKRPQTASQLSLTLGAGDNRESGVDPAAPKESPRSLSDVEAAALAAVPVGEAVSVDVVMESEAVEQFGPGRALAALTTLEMKRLLRRLPGNRLERT
ncbi:DNA-processing protein DprA [Alienimonas sp. DA493]|uniref:DNA-processing protein DprA n=1 Tax=Alienimonas sp. DA493 TaxID=3373605 RepID=UPI0037544F89